MRADHLGYDGYERATSANIDALAARGVVFSQARSTGPQTRFSVPCFMTSKYFTELERTTGDWPRIAESETTFVEILDEAGYHTAAFHSIGYLSALYGMAQGFDHYDTSCMEVRSPVQHNITSDYITDRTLAYVDSSEFPKQQPFLLWTYYGDPHSDYRRHEDAPKYGPSRADNYDSEIFYTDMQIGRLLEGLEERGLMENTIVVVSSDHGEGLREEEDHGHLFHGATLYDEVMRIPLIIASPRWPHRVVDTPVSLIDLAPTFIELAGLEPKEDARGISLKPWLEGEDREHPPLFFEKQKETALPQKGMLLWPYKVILVMPYNRIKIFNLEEDPKEQNDLAKTLPPEQRDELVGLLKYWASQVLVVKEPTPK